jgi:UDP-N-acetylglucosamine 4,6-dehydratase/5-epimerase
MTEEKNKKEIKNILKNKVVLVTGGAGSIGSVIISKLLEYPVDSVRALDWNEHALFNLKNSLNDERFRPLLGNIIDLERIEMAMSGVDIIIHTAAVKNIEITEFNPMETIEVNTIGTMNLIKCVIKHKPEIFINISTDKAAEPSTLYGSTKQLGERLTSWAGKHILNTKFSTVRLGNIIETRGNVFEIWEKELKAKKPLSITDPLMERYFFHVSEATDFILNCLKLTDRGEIFVPKMKLQKIVDLATKLSNNHKYIGIRQGEKLQEILMSDMEKEIAIERKDMWIIKNYGDRK